MSQQFDVEFFGAIPIDPSYVMMIEGGAEGDESNIATTATTSTKVESDQINGAQDVTDRNHDEANKIGVAQQKPRPLVDRYASSGLCSIFEKITARLIEKTTIHGGAG